MLPPIFADDAPLDARQEAAAERLLSMCPPMLKATFRPIVRQQIAGMDSRAIDALMIDVNHVVSSVEAGEYATVYETAKRWGATDEMIALYAPALSDANKT